MSIKLIAVDLDDTLLDDRLTVSPRACAAIRTAVSKGVIVTIATGRMFCSAMQYAKQLDLDVPLITYNGGLIRSSRSKEIFLHQTIPQELARDILTLFKQHNWYIQSYIDDVLYVEEMDEYACGYEKLAGIAAVPIGDKLFDPQSNPTKLLAIREPQEIKTMYEVVKKEFGDKIYATNSKANYLEMMNPEVNKGRAVAYLAHELGIAQAEIMAVGDSNNDLDMIKYAGLGVAMGNASDKVKSYAQAVTRCNNEDGVAEAIEKYVLASS